MPDAGRVIAGIARGRRLVAPGPGTRPLGDRVKQTLFAVLEPRLAGAAVLDLCAGSGAAGIEALSRGADLAVFVERDGDACRVIAENLGRLGLAGDRVTIVRAEAVGWLGRGRPAGSRPFDIAIVDPPYAETGLLARILEQLGRPDSAVLAAAAVVVAKHFWRERPPATAGLLASRDERRFGETSLTFYAREGGLEAT